MGSGPCSPCARPCQWANKRFLRLPAGQNKGLFRRSFFLYDPLLRCVHLHCVRCLYSFTGCFHRRAFFVQGFQKPSRLLALVESVLATIDWQRIHRFRFAIAAWRAAHIPCLPAWAQGFHQAEQIG